MAKVENVCHTWSENSTTNAIRRFAKEVPQLKETSTVQGWRTGYLREIARKTRDNEDVMDNFNHQLHFLNDRPLLDFKKKIYGHSQIFLVNHYFVVQIMNVLS